MGWKNEHEARDEIKQSVRAYYRQFIADDASFAPGDRINYSGRVYDEEELTGLTDAMLDFWLTAGRFASEFESLLASYLGVKYAHLANSGSSANLLAFMALTAPELGGRRIKRGDEVIAVACAFPTTVAPIIQHGAVPVFIDVTIPQYNIDVSLLEDALSGKTKAVFIAHTLGNPFDLKAVRFFCDRHDLWLIEDNCDALGSEYAWSGSGADGGAESPFKAKTKKTGAWGDISTCSFYPPHHITMGEGGAVCTNDPLLSRLILSCRDWGRDCVCPPGKDDACGHRFDGQHGQLPEGYDHKYVYSHLGYNLKATDLQASIGCAQIKKLPGFVEARRRNWQYLRDALADLEEYLILPEACKNSTPSWFGFLMTVRDESPVSRNSLTAYLEDHNIQTRLLFSGNLLRHPCFDELRGTDAYRVVGGLEHTDRIMNDSFWIGVYPGMDEDMLGYMSDMLHNAFS